MYTLYGKDHKFKGKALGTGLVNYLIRPGLNVAFYMHGIEYLILVDSN